MALQQDDAAQHVLELAAHEEGAYILLDDDGLVLLQEGAVLLAGDASADVGLSPTQGGVVSEQGTDARGSTHTYACAHAHIHTYLYMLVCTPLHTRTHTIIIVIHMYTHPNTDSKLGSAFILFYTFISVTCPKVKSVCCFCLMVPRDLDQNQIRTL